MPNSDACPSVKIRSPERYVREEQGDKARALEAYEAALATIEKAVTLKPDEVTYTASKAHALARIEGMKRQ